MFRDPNNMSLTNEKMDVSSSRWVSRVDFESIFVYGKNC